MRPAVQSWQWTSSVREIEQPDRFQRGAAEEDEPLAVVFVVVAVLAVELGAIVVLRLVNEVDRHLVARQRALQERAGHRLAADRDFEPDAGLLDRPARVECLPERGHHDDRLVAQIGQFERQAAADVAEAAGLAERHRLGGGKQDFHASVSIPNSPAILAGSVARFSLKAWGLGIRPRMGRLCRRHRA